MPQVAQFDVPWPPTVNHIWRAVNGRNVLASRYRSWRKNALIELMAARAKPVPGPVRITINLYPPNNVNYDLDNRAKATLDLLVEGGIIEADDCRIVRGLCLTHEEPANDGIGFARVFVEQVEAA